MTAPWGVDLDAVVKTYVQNTPRLAPYRKSISNVVGLLLGLVAFLATVPTEWLPPAAGVPIAFGAWVVTNVATYFVPANAATEAQARQAAEILARERAEAAAQATSTDTSNAGAADDETPVSIVDRGTLVGPDGAGY